MIGCYSVLVRILFWCFAKGAELTESVLFNLTFEIHSSGKYFLKVQSERPQILHFEVEVTGKTSSFYIKARSRSALFYFRVEAKPVKLKVTATRPITGRVIARSGYTSLALRVWKMLTDLSLTKTKNIAPVKVEGLTIREISTLFPNNFVSGRLGKDVFTELRSQGEIPFGGTVDDYEFSEDVISEFARQYDELPDDGLIFILDGRGITSEGRKMLALWVSEAVGNPRHQEGRAWDLLRSNPGVGAVTGGGRGFGSPPKWNHGQRFEKMLDELGISSADIENAGGNPPFMLIRKSALIALKALNFSSVDLTNGLINNALLEWALLPMIERAGALVVSVPRERSYLLQYENLDEVRFFEHRTLDNVDGRDVCLFVGLMDKSGNFSSHALHYLKSLRIEGLLVIALGVVTGCIHDVVDPGPEFCDGFAARENSGYDFAIWATALRKYPELWGAKSLLLVNDSVFVAQRSLSRVITELTNSPFDITGLTASGIEHFHLQSYLIHFKSSALQNETVRNFWRNVIAWKDKFRIISAYEVAMTAKFESAGLTCGSLFDPQRNRVDQRCNPSIHLWREILREGYPFVKVQLLRDNPTREYLNDWQKLLEGYQFNVRAILDELSRSDNPAITDSVSKNKKVSDDCFFCGLLQRGNLMLLPFFC